VSGAQYDIICPPVHTFHAYGMRLISVMERRGYLHNARLILNDSEITKLIRTTIDALNAKSDLDDKFESTPEFIREFLSMIEFIKSTSTLNEVEAQLKQPIAESSLSRFKPKYLTGFLQFEIERKNLKVRTLTDLIFDPVTVIRENPEIAHIIANQFDHILVDEFQDINFSQMEMLLTVAGTRAKITVVGDEDQAIFAWRGASAKFIKQLQDTFENVKTYILPHTFRFGHRVALAANHVIAHNVGRMDKLCISSETTPDTKISILMSEYDSGSPAAASINNWLSEGRLLVDIAVLVREYSHSLSVEAALLQNNIPYCIVGAQPFFNRPEVLSLRGCLQLASGGLENMDKEKLHAVLESMFKIPGLYLKNEQIEDMCKKASYDPSNFIGVCKYYEHMLSQSGLKSYRLKALRSSITAWESCMDTPKGVRASTFLENIVRKLGLYEYFDRNSVIKGSSERERMVRGLIHAASAEMHTVESFSALLDDLVHRYDATRDDDCIMITSIHRAKGMEWPCVILPELSETNFPGSSKKEILTEEVVGNERNLFYVGMTRAKEQLLLICPKDPLLQKWSEEGLQYPPPLESIVASRFLFEGNFAVCSSAGKSIYKNEAPNSRNAVIDRYLNSVIS
jgi:DNA helicase-2/ATP-dependent DNA helicase PcrA